MKIKFIMLDEALIRAEIGGIQKIAENIKKLELRLIFSGCIKKAAQKAKFLNSFCFFAV